MLLHQGLQTLFHPDHLEQNLQHRLILLHHYQIQARQDHQGRRFLLFLHCLIIQQDRQILHQLARRFLHCRQHHQFLHCRQ